MSERNWQAEYDDACAELRLVEAQHQLVQKVLAECAKELGVKAGKVLRLYQERVAKVNGDDTAQQARPSEDG